MASQPADYLPSPEALRGALKPKSAAEVVLIAAQCLRVGSLDYASAVCEAWDGPADASITLMRAAALFGRGDHESGLRLVDGVLSETPDNLAALFYRAQMAQHAGDGSRAETLLLSVLQRFADFPGAQAALASLRMPGPSYRDVLRRLHELVRPRSYLEIGVETGATLALAQNAERVIGIDPDASALRPELVPRNARLFHQTSDAFFAGQTRAQVLGGHRLDFGFVDGMHLFEYALRDFLHLEAWSAPDGVIVLHDCLPILPLTAERERQTKFWLGDVWKVVRILGDYRPELSVKVIATAPSGLCVVRRLDPSSRVLSERFEEIVERYQGLAFPGHSAGVPSGFHCVPASEAGVRQALE